MKELSHTDKKGKANMVDVGQKPDQRRTAKASGKIKLAKGTITLIRNNEMKKGDVISTAEIAGIMAAKKTSELIPLCHPLLLTKINVSLKIIKDGILAESTVKCCGQTGVEMEALNAVCISLLTIYDMCKAVDKSMIIHDIKLIEKTKSDL